MTTLLALTTWWFLVSVDGPRGADTRIQGPFPTAELCRVAGELTVPSDRRFWLPAKVAKAEQEDRERAARYEQEWQAKLAQARVMAKTAKPGSAVTVGNATWHVTKDQTIDEESWSLSLYGFESITLGATSALSGCLSTDQPVDAATWRDR